MSANLEIRDVRGGDDCYITPDGVTAKIVVAAMLRQQPIRDSRSDCGRFTQTIRDLLTSGI